MEFVERTLLVINILISMGNAMLLMVIISYLKIDAVQVRKHNKEI